ncbi:22970_t:CDS:1, partial [Gigaspora margarita]
MTSTITKPTIDSGTNWSTITEEFANHLEWKINRNNHESQNNSVVSGIVKQVSGKKIWISLHRLLEIVKPEVHQEIINSIANPDISRYQHIPCKAKRKCKA